ncbi:MAG: hypothetical protein HY079_02900 [Elusimicrobia bacterium]|nr:hypothetical protein [Elusimicrobiota bacterium]
MAEDDLDWLGDLRWRGYPRLTPVRDIASEPQRPAAAAAPAPIPDPDPRVAELARENEALRAKLERLTRLADEFERRLREAGHAYEGALLETESRLRDAALERERLGGELGAARSESARLTARDAAREAELRRERERRADAEKALALARRQVEDLAERAERLRAESAERAGAAAELRRMASAHMERLVLSKELTDQDVATLRQELKDFLARLHRAEDAPGDTR